MTGTWMRRACLALACGTALLAAVACGSSNIASAFNPTRFVAFGDTYSDVGQGGSRYTVNDGSAYNTWVEKVVSDYGLSLAPVSQGGTSWARANARIATKPDAAGNAATLTLAGQIDAFLAAGGAFGAGDMVLISGGTSDLIAETMAYRAGTSTEAQLNANVSAAGKALGQQVRRLVSAGAQHVVVTGAINLGRTPWGVGIAEVDRLTNLSVSFNNSLLTEIVDLGNNVLYIDAAYFINIFTSSPATYGYDDITNPACASIDPNDGLGLGAGKVNSSLCTLSTLANGADITKRLFADLLFFTPNAQRSLGDLIYQRIRVRW
jgi:phospholipase/lecithinase/hemolysin